MKKTLSVFASALMLIPAMALAASGANSGGLMNRASTPMGIRASSAIMNTLKASSVSGTVSGITGSSISLTGSNGTAYTVDASSAKIVRKFGATMQITDIQTGDALMVVGTVSGTSITAKTIRDNSQQQKNASFSGSVTAVNGASFTLLTKNRGSQTINTGSSTMFKENGQSSVSMSNVTVGENVNTSGVWDSTSNTVAASSVTIVVKTGSITGSLTAISGTSLTVTASGTNATLYTVDASNVKKVDRRYGASTNLSALQVGDILTVRGVINGTNVAASSVRDMSLQARSGTFVGTISALGGDGSSFTLQSKQRGSQAVNTTSSTVFKQGSQAAGFSSLAVGQTLTVSGVWDRTNSNITAVRVAIKVASTNITGTLSAITGTGLTVVAGSTTYSVDASKAAVLYKGGRKGSLSILQANDQVQVRGQMVSGSTGIAATYVRDLSQTYTATSTPQQ